MFLITKLKERLNLEGILQIFGRAGLVVLLLIFWLKKVITPLNLSDWTLRLLHMIPKFATIKIGTWLKIQLILQVSLNGLDRNFMIVKVKDRLFILVHISTQAVAFVNGVIVSKPWLIDSAISSVLKFMVMLMVKGWTSTDPLKLMKLLVLHT